MLKLVVASTVLVSLVAKLLGLCVPAAAALVAAFWVYTYLHAYWPHYQLKRLPTIKTPPAPLFGGHMPVFDTWDEVYKVCKDYGPIFKAVLIGKPYVVITDSSALKEVLSDNFHESFNTRPSFGDHGIFSGEHLFTQPYDRWKSSRRALTPSFNTMNLTKFAKVINEAGQEFCSRLGEASSSKKEVEIWRMYGSVTLQVITGTSFGESLRYSDELGATLAIKMQNMFRTGDDEKQAIGMRINAIFPFLGYFLSVIPFGPMAKKYACRKFMDDTAQSMIDKMKGGDVSAEKKRSFLHLLINAIDEKTGRKFSDKEVLDQSFLFMFAGYETTANTLSFATYSITKNPSVLKKLQQEIDDNYPESGDVGYNDLKKFPYLDMVIQETLRMFPPLSMISLIREAAQDTTILGHKIPKGTNITMPQMLIHRDPKMYPNPEEFKPERWDPLGEEAKLRHRYSWVPFGEGPRKCIGYRFALEELKILLINVFKKYTFEIGPTCSQPLDLSNPFTGLSPKNGLFLIPKAR